MSGKSIISNAYLEDIGDAIRQKKGTEDTYYPSQMGDAIRSIEGIIPSGTLEIDANGTYDVTQYSEATVDVPDPVITSLTVTEDGTYSVPQGVDGYNPVTVNTGVAELQEEIDSAVEASGCDPLVEGINALTAQANAVTGKTDSNLTDAVGTLIDGYPILDIATKVKLENDAFQIVIPFSGAGAYYVVPYPPVIKSEALASGYSYVFAAGGFLYAETSGALVAFPSSTYNDAGLLGYWGGKVSFKDSAKQEIIFRGNTTDNVHMLGNREYYILKPKQSY